MKSTTKRRIAREWLTFLAAITLGFFIAYGVFYQGHKVKWDQFYFHGQSAEYPKYLVFEVPYGGDSVRRYYAKPQNPGDMFNDLWPLIYVNRIPPYEGFPTRRWNQWGVRLWLCILSPYLVFCFLRSVVWSVNTLRRP